MAQLTTRSMITSATALITTSSSSSSFSSSSSSTSRQPATPFIVVGVLTTVPMGILVLFLAVTWQAAGVGSACPHDVSNSAHACFTDYSAEYQNMQNSPSSLCCGVDVETLRAFCSSYMEAMRCIDKLKADCPGSPAPEKAMSNLHGAQSALKSLCADDGVIEIYARHQQCLTAVGNDNMKCLKNHLNTSDNVRLLANVDSKHVSEFCSDMRVTLRCVQNNVNRHCGKEAAKLAATLVKPMIRQSTKCDYSIVTKAPVYRQGQPSPSSRDQSQTAHQRPSGCSAVATWSSVTLLFVLWLPSVIRTLLLPS